jgi:tripartite-type tricarboxylate transporter receptor subunit TctC
MMRSGLPRPKLSHPGLLSLAAVAFLGSSVLAQAETPAEFFKGKTIDLVIGYASGGGNDLYARALARFMGHYIPGNPAIVARNMPGAGSFVAANRMFNVAAKDGTSIALGAPTIGLDEKLGTTGVNFKTSEFNWLGRINARSNLIMMWKTSKVKSIADAQKYESVLASTAVSSTVWIYPNLLNKVIGTKFKQVLGYKGSNEAMLAMERGEAEGHSTSIDAVKSAHSDWIRDKDINVIVTFAMKRSAEFPDLPTAVELGRNDEEKKILSAVMSTAEIGTAFYTTPGVPADRVVALRRAFDATVADPQFIEFLTTSGGAVAPMPGEELQKLVAEVADLSPEMTAKVKAVYQQ